MDVMAKAPTREEIAASRRRPDGWPYCPICDEDELFSLAMPARADDIDGCYLCGWLTDRKATP